MMTLFFLVELQFLCLPSRRIPLSNTIMMMACFVLFLCSMNINTGTAGRRRCRGSCCRFGAMRCRRHLAAAAAAAIVARRMMSTVVEQHPAFFSLRPAKGEAVVYNCTTSRDATIYLFAKSEACALQQPDDG